MDEQLPLPWNTLGGYDVYEVLSVLQKSIRRGLEEDALFWATELYLSGCREHVWRRLRIIASEDVGLAVPSMVTDIQALYNAWKISTEGENRLFFVHAVLLLARSPKSRIVDNALMVYFEGPRPLREIPDYALDKHTRRGREMGRGNKHFFAVGALLGKQTLEDPYEERAKQVRK